MKLCGRNLQEWGHMRLLSRSQQAFSALHKMVRCPMDFLKDMCYLQDPWPPVSTLDAKRSLRTNTVSSNVEAIWAQFHSQGDLSTGHQDVPDQLWDLRSNFKLLRSWYSSRTWSFKFHSRGKWKTQSVFPMLISSAHTVVLSKGTEFLQTTSSLQGHQTAESWHRPDSRLTLILNALSFPSTTSKNTMNALFFYCIKSSLLS